MKASVGQRAWKRVRSLLGPGRIEVVLSALLIVFLLLFPTKNTPLGTGLDILAYVFAAMTARWPRAGAALLAAFLAVRGFLPRGMGSLSEYAALFVLLGVGMRGEIVMRRVLAAIYLPLLVWVTRVFAPDSTALLQSLFLWMLLIGLVWVIGSASHGYTAALRRAHVAEAQLQRQVLARELHDTVARSFTQVSMVAERARLHGGATNDDLDTISDAASRGVDELRLIMGLLRDPHASISAIAADTSLGEGLAAAEKSLRSEGFNTAVSVEGDLDRLDEARSSMLAAVIAEAAANIVRHGDADQPAGIVLRVDDAQAELVVINMVKPDDRSSSQPMGLWGMRQRVEAAQGSVQVGAEGQHWVVRVEVPLAAKAVS